MIVIGIIGIVADMTIPTLVTSYEKKVTAVKVKKIYSEFSQAIRMSEAENGPMEDWDYGSNVSAANTRTFFNQYFKHYIRILREDCPDGKDDSCTSPVSGGGINMILANGVGLSFVVQTHDYLYFFFDINCTKKPNLLGKDRFYFIGKNEFMPYGWHQGLTRESILNGYDFNEYKLSCKKDAVASELYRYGCTALLMLDNWEFKDDYPW